MSDTHKTEHHESGWKVKTVDLIMKAAVPMFFATLFLGAVSIFGLTKLGSAYDYRIWFKADDPHLAAYDKFEREFGNDDNFALVVTSPSGVFDKETVALIHQLTDELWHVRDVIDVESLATYQVVHSKDDDIVIEPLLPKDLAKLMLPQAPLAKFGPGRAPASASGPVVSEPDVLKEREALAATDPNIINHLLSKDHKVTILYGKLKAGSSENPEYRDTLRDVHAIIERHRGEGDHEFRITGQAAVAAAFNEITMGDLERLTPIMVIIAIVVLYSSVRSFSGAFLALGILALTILATFGIAGWLGIKFNMMTASLPNILIAVSLADGVHVLTAFYRNRSLGLDKREALRASLIHNIGPMVLRTLTTVLGFAAFSLSPLGVIKDFGFLALLGTCISWVLMMGIAPAFMLYTPSKVKPLPINLGEEGTAKVVGYLGWVQRYSTPIIVVWFALFGAGCYVAAQNDINADVMSYFDEKVPVKVADRYMIDHVGGSRGLEIMLDSGVSGGAKDPVFLGKAEELQKWVATQPKVTKVLSLVDIVKDVNQALNGDLPEFYSIPPDKEKVAQSLFLYSMSSSGAEMASWSSLDQGRMRVKVLWTIDSSKEMLEFIERLETKAKEIGLKASITGKSALIPVTNNYIVETLNTSDTMSLALITILLILVFRSFKLGMVSLIPNLFPAVLGASVMTLLGKPYDVAMVLVLSVVMGIAVDDTVHFLTHYRDKTAEGKTPMEAITGVFAETYMSMATTTAVLVISFSVLCFGRYTPMVNFGIMSAVALGIALAGDLTLLPALLLRKSKASA